MTSKKPEPKELISTKIIIYILVSFLSFSILNIFYIFFIDRFDMFHTNNELGDTIGGLTAPIVNSIAALLVYKSFKAQVSANERQFEATQTQFEELRTDREIAKSLADFDRTNELIKELEHHLEEYSFVFNRKSVEGSNAVKSLKTYIIQGELKNLRSEYVENKLAIFTNLMVLLKFTCDQINNTNSNEINTKNILSMKFSIVISRYNIYLKEILDCIPKKINSVHTNELEKIESILNLYFESYTKLNFVAP